MVDENVTPDAVPDAMKQRMVAGSADQVAEQIKTNVLDAGIDGVIINMPTHLQGYQPGVITAVGQGAEGGPGGLNLPDVANLTELSVPQGTWTTTVDAVLDVTTLIQEQLMSHPGATPSDRHKVVIIGSGFGGLTAAKALKRADVDIKIIAKTTHHLFQPLLYQVATGIISSGDIAPPTRMILRKQKNAQVLLGEATHVDLVKKSVRSKLLGHTYITPYDTLIVAAGAGQSYFGNDHFAEFAPGMKSIDDALELRGRILGAFEQAERSSDPARREKLLTFTVVGAGPTGVEMAGQIAELADHTLKGAFRHIDSTKARVILLDAAPAVLPPMGEKLGKKAQARLEKMGVEIQLNAMVTDVDRNGITVKDSDGTTRRIECATKVWSAGVSASPLGKRSPTSRPPRSTGPDG